MNMRHWADFNDKNPDEALQELCCFAWASRNEPPDSPLRERVAAELKVIRELGYARMFLFLYSISVIQAIARYVVCASGALAGSATAYLLGVSGINPLEQPAFRAFHPFSAKDPANSSAGDEHQWL